MNKQKMKSGYEHKDWHISPDFRKRLGVKGEDIACTYLENQGIKVIDRNVRYKPGELDIVAIDKNRLCFIEVKTRKSYKYGRPSLSITAAKQSTIRALAQLYLKTHLKYKSYIPRIDVIEIVITDENKAFINYIKSAF